MFSGPCVAYISGERDASGGGDGGEEQLSIENNHFTEMCSGSEAGSSLRPIYTCITQLKAQGPSRTCNESKEEEEEVTFRAKGTRPAAAMEARNELPSGEGSGVTRRGCAPAWGWVGAI